MTDIWGQYAWAFFALAAPFLWCLSNLIDQFLIRSTSMDMTPFAYTIIQAALYPFSLLLLVFFYPAVLDVRADTALLLVAISPLWIISVWFYVAALKREDASQVVPLFNMAAVFVLLFGWFFLGEVISFSHIIAGLFCLLASAALMWDFRTNRIRFSAFLLMLAVTIMTACYSVVTRALPDIYTGVQIYFWYCLGFSVISLVATVFYPAARHSILKLFSNEGRPNLFLMVGQSFFDIIAMIAITTAIVIAPTAAHVSLVASAQPLIILLVAGTAGIFLPKIYHPLRWDRQFQWKLICIAVIIGSLIILIVNE